MKVWKKGGKRERNPWGEKTGRQGLEKHTGVSNGGCQLQRQPFGKKEAIHTPGISQQGKNKRKGPITATHHQGESGEKKKKDAERQQQGPGITFKGRDGDYEGHKKVGGELASLKPKGRKGEENSGARLRTKSQNNGSRKREGGRGGSARGQPRTPKRRKGARSEGRAREKPKREDSKKREGHAGRRHNKPEIHKGLRVRFRRA